MKNDLIVHCVFAESDTTISELLDDSFCLFLARVLAQA